MAVAGRQVTVWKSALQNSSTQILRVVTVLEWSLSNSSAQILRVVTVLEWSLSNSSAQILRVVTVLELALSNRAYYQTVNIGQLAIFFLSLYFYRIDTSCFCLLVC